ncbi:MAG: FAD-dependent monooxygenase [Pikeienuella sp.]
MAASGERTALIAGGGIGGLAAALALARAGWRVGVFERAERFGEVGAGLQMSPNACRVLQWLGVYDKVAATAFRPEAAQMRDGHTGSSIYRISLGEAAERRWGAPYLHVHRSDLHSVLLAAARTAGVALHTGRPVVTFGNRPEGVRLRLADDKVETGDLLVAADGIRSVLRGVLNGPEEPRFTDQIAWRTTIPVERLPDGLVAPEATVWAGPGRHLVTYYLRGGKLVNIVAVEETEDGVAEDWATDGDPDRLFSAFAGWHRDVLDLLSAVQRPFIWGLYERPEQVRWCTGRAALLGDAAHAMLPFMAQGAAMALEDAAELVRALQSFEDVPEALLAYEQARWSRVTRVQAQSRSNGLLFHKRTELGRLLSWAPIAAVAWLAPGLAAAQLDWLYGYDVTEGLG